MGTLLGGRHRHGSRLRTARDPALPFSALRIARSLPGPGRPGHQRSLGTLQRNRSEKVFRTPRAGLDAQATDQVWSLKGAALRPPVSATKSIQALAAEDPCFDRIGVSV